MIVFSFIIEQPSKSFWKLTCSKFAYLVDFAEICTLPEKGKQSTINILDIIYGNNS